MKFQVIILVYQITILSLLIEGSPLQSYEESSPTMNVCNMKEKMSSMHNKKHITFIKNTTTVFECAFHCKVDARCNFWTLHKDNKYCDLFGEEGDLREDINAISGSKDCAGKPTEKQCKSIASFSKDCQKNTDEEYCRAITENFEENCPQCNLRDKMSRTPNGKHKIFLQVNNTNVFECAYHCKVDARCQYWTFEKGNKYCDLFGEEGDLRKDVHAISGSKYCVWKQSAKLCLSMKSFVNDCKENSLVENIDDEHCQAVSDTLDNICTTSSSSNNNNTTTPNPLCKEYNRIYDEECKPVDRYSEHCQDIWDLLQDYCGITRTIGYSDKRNSNHRNNTGNQKYADRPKSNYNPTTTTTQTATTTKTTTTTQTTSTTQTATTTQTTSITKTTTTTQTTLTTKTTSTTQRTTTTPKTTTTTPKTTPTQTATTIQTTTTTQTTSTTQTTTSYKPTTTTQTMQPSQTNPAPSTIPSLPPTSPVCNEMIDALYECKNNMVLTEQCQAVIYFVENYCIYYYDDGFGGPFDGQYLNHPSNFFYPKDPIYTEFTDSLYDPNYHNIPNYLNDPSYSDYPNFQNIITRIFATFSYLPGYHNMNTCNFDYFGYIKNEPTKICRNTFKAMEHCGFGKIGAVNEFRETCQGIWNIFKKFCGYFDQPCISENCQNLISIGEMCTFGSYAHPAIPADEACMENFKSFKMHCGYNY